MTLLTRATLTDLELRADGRTLVGLAVPYDVEARIGSYTEIFRRGAFLDAVANPATVKLLGGHDANALPLGRALTLREDTTGLVGEFRVSATRAGDDVLALIADGAVSGLSIGFIPAEGGDRWNRDRTLVERVKAALAEVSIVAFPAYAGAGILAVREALPSRAHLLGLARWR